MGSSPTSTPDRDSSTSVPDSAEAVQDAVSARCPELAAQVAAAAWPDWNTPLRIRELSSSRMPGEHELAEIAAQLRRAVASALDLAYPDPEAVRLTKLADQIAKRTD